MPPVTPVAGKFGSADVGFFLVDGYNLLAAKLQAVRYKREALQQLAHGCGDNAVANTPTGVMRAEVGQEGAFFDTASNSSHDALSGGLPSSPQSAVRLMALNVARNVIGQAYVAFEGAYQQFYEVLSKVNELTRANAEYVVCGAFDPGVILHAHGTDVAAGNTQSSSVDNTTQPQRVIPITSNSQANPTVVTTPVPHLLTTGDTVLIAGVSGSSPTINGERTVTVISSTTFSVPVDTSGGSGGTGGSFTRGKTQNGGFAHLQVESVVLGGYTSWTIKLRHSADDSTYADLATFTNVTARTAERVTVAGTVNRYLASSAALNGAGSGPSIKYMCGFSRT